MRPLAAGARTAVRARRGPPKAQRKPAAPARRRRIVRAGMAAIGAGMLAAALWFAAGTAGQRARALFADGTAALGFAVQEITVEGRNHTSADALLQAIAVGRGTPILTLDLDDLRRRVEAIGWVRSATVERRLPDGLHLALVERAPFARWQRDGVTLLIDRDGVVLQPDDPGRFGDLRRVVGAGAVNRAGELFDLLGSEPALFARVQNAIRVRGRRWDIEFDNGLIARLPEQGAAASWRRLALLEREQHLLERDIVAVDLRQPDRLYVQLTPEALAARRTPGKDT